MKALDRPRPWWLPPPGHVHSAWWIAIAALLVVADRALGFSAEFPVIYVIPVSLAAWYSGRSAAVALAAVVPASQLLSLLMVDTDAGSLLVSAAIMVLRGAVVMVMALWVARLSEHERELHHEVQTLKGLLPICSFCKSIRNESGEWERLERFISRRSETEFSHGMCPSCLATQYPNLPKADA